MSQNTIQVDRQQQADESYEKAQDFDLEPGKECPESTEEDKGTWFRTRMLGGGFLVLVAGAFILFYQRLSSQEGGNGDVLPNLVISPVVVPSNHKSQPEPQSTRSRIHSAQPHRSKWTSSRKILIPTFAVVLIVLAVLAAYSFYPRTAPDELIDIYVDPLVPTPQPTPDPVPDVSEIEIKSTWQWSMKFVIGFIILFAIGYSIGYFGAMLVDVLIIRSLLPPTLGVDRYSGTVTLEFRAMNSTSTTTMTLPRDSKYEDIIKKVLKGTNETEANVNHYRVLCKDRKGTDELMAPQKYVIDNDHAKDYIMSVTRAEGHIGFIYFEDGRLNCSFNIALGRNCSQSFSVIKSSRIHTYNQLVRRMKTNPRMEAAITENRFNLYDASGNEITDLSSTPSQYSSPRIFAFSNQKLYGIKFNAESNTLEYNLNDGIRHVNVRT